MCILRRRETAQVGAQARQVAQLRQLRIGFAQTRRAVRPTPQAGPNERLLQVQRAATVNRYRRGNFAARGSSHNSKS